jgi:hypothetical protein
MEKYSPKRKAEFLLNKAVDEADYRDARKEVRRLSLDPDSIPHVRPPADSRFNVTSSF